MRAQTAAARSCDRNGHSDSVEKRRTQSARGPREAQSGQSMRGWSMMREKVGPDKRMHHAHRWAEEGSADARGMHWLWEAAAMFDAQGRRWTLWRSETAEQPQGTHAHLP